MLNVDGGYLTFKLAFGGFDSWIMKYGANVAMFAVDNRSKRKELYPQYKQYRNIDPDKQAVVKMVWELRKRVETEATLPLCSIKGLEADDLVACWYLFNQSYEIVGVDKDFFQLPNMNHCFYHNMQAYTRLNAIEKLPSYVQELALLNFALYQILLGDVADNIPRLLSKGKKGKEEIRDAFIAMEYNVLNKWLLNVYGYDAQINAALVLLPYFEEGNFEGNWFTCWCEGDYYKSGNWQGLQDKILGCLGENKVSQDVETLEMFSLL